jgi:hypothetical protein
MENTNTPTSVKSDNELQITIDDFKLIKSFYPEFTRKQVESNTFVIGWSELMPVVEKIENIRHIGIDAVYLQIEGRKCQIWTYFDVKEFLRLTGDDKNEGNKFKVQHSAKTKLDATYHSVVEFIKWYNITTNENGE